ncbi:MAG: RnfABCDGE type electron transport complex subunit G [Saccharofermentanales bacterium]
MQNKKTDIKDNPVIAALILFVIALVVTAALASANEVTKDIIIKQAKIDQDNARLEVFPSAVSFADISGEYISDATPKITSVFTALDGNSDVIGLVVISAAKGYSGDVTIMSGISLDRKVSGIKVISDNETPGLGKKIADEPFTRRFLNKKSGLLFSLKETGEDVNKIDAITGVTISSTAMVNALNLAIEFSSDVYKTLDLKGGN